MSIINHWDDSDGIRKTAIFLSSLDQKTATRILNQLDPLIAKKVRLELLSVFDIEKNVRKNVLAEFINGQLSHQKDNISSSKQYSYKSEGEYCENENVAVIDLLRNGSLRNSSQDNVAESIDPSELAWDNESDSKFRTIGNDEGDFAEKIYNDQTDDKISQTINSKKTASKINFSSQSVNKKDRSQIMNDSQTTDYKDFLQNPDEQPVIRLYEKSDFIHENALKDQQEILLDVVDNPSIFVAGANDSRVSIPFQSNTKVQSDTKTEIKTSENVDRFNFLLTLKKRVLADLLKMERPTIIAAILMSLPNTFNKELLTCFAPEKRFSIEQCLSQLKEPNPLLMNELEDELYRICYCSQCKITKG